MKILKYSPLFFIYYAIRPYEKKDIIKSIIANIILLFVVAIPFILEQQEEVIEKSYVRDKNNMSDSIGIKGSLGDALNELDSENSEESDLEGATDNETNEKETIKSDEEYANNLKTACKSYFRNMSNSKNLDGDLLLLTWWMISGDYNTNYVDIIPPTMLEEYKAKESLEELSLVQQAERLLSSLPEKEEYMVSDIIDTITGGELTEKQVKNIDEITQKIKENPEDPIIYDVGDSIVDNVVRAYLKANDSKLYFDNYVQENYIAPKLTNHVLGMENLAYYWQNPIYEELNKWEKKKITGPLGEVGYKGLFPVFIQGDPVDELSKMPWRFQGGYTNLGESACSLYSLCSVLHAAGYGDYEIPGTKDKPTMQNLVKYFPNGPITGMHTSRYYDVKFRSTATNEGLEGIFNDLLIGIPYIINVRYGVVNAYRTDGTVDKTIFTSSGHFMVFESAKIENGVRLVSLVQSSRSDASLGRLDQNDAWFDFDELIEKKVMRSSVGTAVPAYTVVGGTNLPKPIYLSSGADKMRKQIIFNHRKDNEWLKEFIEKYEMDINQSMAKGSTLKSGEVIRLNRPVVINYINDSTIVIFITKDNAVMVTNITMKSNLVGKRKAGAQLCMTTKDSKAYIVQKNELGEFEVVLTGSAKEDRSVNE